MLRAHRPVNVQGRRSVTWPSLPAPRGGRVGRRGMPRPALPPFMLTPLMFAPAALRPLVAAMLPGFASPPVAPIRKSRRGGGTDERRCKERQGQGLQAHRYLPGLRPEANIGRGRGESAAAMWRISIPIQLPAD